MRFFFIIMGIFSLSAAFSAVTAKELKGRDWDVNKDFRGKKASLELSGAVCPGNDGRKRWCLVVNDERRWAQFFSVSEEELKPKDSILLLVKEEDGEKFKEIDAEAAAYDDGYVYVTGSHGMSRSRCNFRQSQFFVFRFPVAKKSGKPKFAISEDTVSPEIERSGKLRQILKKAPSVGPFAEKCLDENGVNFEGLAVADGQMYFGLRGPSIDGHALILEVAADRVFGDAQSSTTVHKLALGTMTGIRDLARVKDGLLVLTGHVNNKDIEPEIHFWDFETKNLTELGELPDIKDKKAETLLLLEEKSDGDEAKYRVLVLYDGFENGNPTEYRLKR